MKRRSKWIAAAIGTTFLVPIVGFYLFMAREGYPTIEGVRNIFERDGQIRIELPSGYTVTDIQFDGDESYSTTIAGNVATIRVGYVGREMMILKFMKEGRTGLIHFGEVSKLNNWNRLQFHAEEHADGGLYFQVYENGVSRDPKSYAIKQTIEEFGTL